MCSALLDLVLLPLPDTLAWMLQNVQLHNLGHLFDDLDKAGSDVSECPETPLQLFPSTPTSDLLLQGHLSHFLAAAHTPPQVPVDTSIALAQCAVTP